MCKKHTEIIVDLPEHGAR